MNCTSPNLAFKHKFVKQKLRFVSRKNFRDSTTGLDVYSTPEYLAINDKCNWEPVTLPCGQCIDCRLENSKQKAIRLVHESSQSYTGKSCFLTLTYDDDNLPLDDKSRPIYDYADIKNFVRSLNDFLRYKFPDKKIPEVYRFKTFGCAEYGEKFSRPHFHLCIINFDFDDKYYWRNSSNDWSDKSYPSYRSNTLEKLWTKGNAEIGTLTEESAAYVARYVTKKVTGEKMTTHYDGLPPERLVCNSKGIGLTWFKKYFNQLFNSGFTVYKEKKTAVPKYYEKKLEKLDPLRYESYKLRKKQNVKKIDFDGTKDRMSVKNDVRLIKYKQLKGKL